MTNQLAFASLSWGGGSVNNAAYCGNSVALDHKSGVNLFSVEQTIASSTTFSIAYLQPAFTSQALSLRTDSARSLSGDPKFNEQTLLLSLSHEADIITHHLSSNQSYSFLNNPYSSLFFAFSRTGNVSKEDSG